MDTQQSNNVLGKIDDSRLIEICFNLRSSELHFSSIANFWLDIFVTKMPYILAEDQSDFNYGVCNTLYFCIASHIKCSAKCDINSKEWVMQNATEYGIIVNISCIAPFANLYFVKKSPNYNYYNELFGNNQNTLNGVHYNIIQDFQEKPFLKEHNFYLHNIETILNEHNITILTHRQLALSVPNITLELSDKANVESCLFCEM